jgi:hypothetical protein
MSNQTANTAAGPIDGYVFVLEKREALYKVSYTVSYADYPKDIIEQNESGDMLDSARNGAARSVEGSKLISESVISFGEYPGREFKVEAPDGKSTLHVRVFLVENRLYSLMVVSIGEHPSPSDIQKFFESFALIEQ